LRERFEQPGSNGGCVSTATACAGLPRPSAVLVSQEVVEASDEAGVTFREIGPVELKGVSGVLRLHAARPVGPDAV
jgi:class 3 adenylate cyclase